MNRNKTIKEKLSHVHRATAVIISIYLTGSYNDPSLCQRQAPEEFEVIRKIQPTFDENRFTQTCSVALWYPVIPGLSFSLFHLRDSLLRCLYQALERTCGHSVGLIRTNFNHQEWASRKIHLKDIFQPSGRCLTIFDPFLCRIMRFVCMESTCVIMTGTPHNIQPYKFAILQLRSQFFYEKSIHVKINMDTSFAEIQTNTDSVRIICIRRGLIHDIP